MTTGDRFEKLVKIMRELRGENGCPWDKEQTHKSLRQYLLEETYEVLECLDEDTIEELPGELGDLLLQVVFHAQIGSENQTFTIDDVLDKIIHKLIQRHPHVFGEAYVETAEEQSKLWERIKRKEGKESILGGVPKALSALLRAYRLQQKAAAVGFDWPDIGPVWDKVHEEMQELREAVQSGDQSEIEKEYGDLLFAMVNLGRFLNVNPEDALRQTIEKFIYRFQKIEDHYRKQGRDLREVPLEEMDEIWEAAKKDTQSTPPTGEPQ